MKELQTKEEYIINNTTWTINLTEKGIIDGYVYTLNITNEHKKGNLYIKKITLDDKTIALGNVEFELYLVGNGETNLYVGTYFTDSNGEIYIENINTGNYILKEKSTNRWFYLADDTPIEIKWSKEFGDTNVTIENEKKKGIIKVIKTDKDFSIALENVKFNIYDEDNNFIETITTNNEGIAESSRLRIDKKYHLVESETLKNYKLDNTIYTIDFTEGLTKEQIENIQTDSFKTFNFTNEHNKGNLVIYKVDSLNSKEFIKGVTFELYATNVDNPYKPNQFIGTFTTDEQGKIEINNLWAGEYLLKETDTDIWHKLNTTDTKLEIKSNETTTLTIKNESKRGYIAIEKQDSEFSNIKIPGVIFNIYDEDARFIESIKTDKNGIAKSSLLKIDKTYYVTEVSTNKSYILSDKIFKVNFTENLTESEIAEIKTDIKFDLNIENEAKTGSIQIIKVDKDNNEYKISGVTFEVFDETLNKVVSTITTDKNGSAKIDNLKVTHTYSVTEKICDNKYKLNDKPLTNIVLKADQITSIKFENEKKKGQIKVIKVDADNKEYKISGVTFEILNSNKKVIEKITTDKNGEAISSKLPCIEETYYLKEINTQKTYVLSDEIKEVTLTEDKITNIVFENEKIKGKLQITKVDSKDTNKHLEGAVFGIYDNTNKLVQKITTNKNGIALSDDLIIGKYYLKELDTGSKYYLLNKNTYEFEIKTNGKIIEQVIDNEIVDISVDIDKIGTVEIMPGDNVDYEFSNIANTSNIYLDNFKWFDYIPTDYIRLETMTTGTWNQDLTYNVYYKTNKSEDYILFKENLSTQENYNLDFSTIEFSEDEYITETCFDFGKVETGFKENIGPTMKCKSLDTLTKDDVFTNRTKTVGTYLELTAETESEWTTIIHIPEKEHEKTLPKTGK